MSGVRQRGGGMTGRKFSLQPFSDDEFSNPFRISGQYARHLGAFLIRWELLGPLDELSIPLPSPDPARRRGLWTGTCFEFFLAPENSAPYREFNLSPSGEWNVFHFSGYRRDMKEDGAFDSLPFRIEREPEALRLSLEIDLGRIGVRKGAVKAGVAAVIKGSTGHLSYWALVHCGPRPDFHRRESFVLVL